MTRSVHDFTTYRNGCRCADCRESHRQRTAETRAAVKGLCPAHLHGTRNGYDHYGCRCQPCRDAHGDSQAEWAERATIRHGSPSAYNLQRCRCVRCKAWKSAAGARYYRAKKAATR